jgi:hypothetical protein
MLAMFLVPKYHAILYKAFKYYRFQMPSNDCKTSNWINSYHFILPLCNLPQITMYVTVKVS